MDEDLGVGIESSIFAVTDENGNFSIEGIPAGTYEVVCWQEKFGKRTITKKVTIGDGDTTENFVFSRPGSNNYL